MWIHLHIFQFSVHVSHLNLHIQVPYLLQNLRMIVAGCCLFHVVMVLLLIVMSDCTII